MLPTPLQTPHAPLARSAFFGARPANVNPFVLHRLYRARAGRISYRLARGAFDYERRRLRGAPAPDHVPAAEKSRAEQQPHAPNGTSRGLRALRAKPPAKPTQAPLRKKSFAAYGAEVWAMHPPAPLTLRTAKAVGFLEALPYPGVLPCGTKRSPCVPRLSPLERTKDAILRGECFLRR